MGHIPRSEEQRKEDDRLLLRSIRTVAMLLIATAATIELVYAPVGSWLVKPQDQSRGPIITKGTQREDRAVPVSSINTENSKCEKRCTEIYKSSSSTSDIEFLTLSERYHEVRGRLDALIAKHKKAQLDLVEYKMKEPVSPSTALPALSLPPELDAVIPARTPTPLTPIVNEVSVSDTRSVAKVTAPVKVKKSKTKRSRTKQPKKRKTRV